MKLSLRFGTKALGVGIFYHAQKRILYVHPLPFVAVLVHRRCEHDWLYPADDHGVVRRRVCTQCVAEEIRVLDTHGFLVWAAEGQEHTIP